MAREPITPPPRRFALALLALLVLVAVGVWRWGMQPPVQREITESAAGTPSPTSRDEPTLPARGSTPKATTGPDAALGALFEQCNKAMMGHMRERAMALRAKQDANSQLALALTPGIDQQHEWSDDTPAAEAARLLSAQSEMAQQAFARARAIDPAHPDLAWLAASKCFEGKRCQAVQQALLDREPDNVATWLLAMGWARRQKDEVALEAAFSRAAAAHRYDTHDGAAMLAVVEAYAGLPTPNVCKNVQLQDWMRKQFPAGDGFDAGTFVAMMALAGERASVLSAPGLSELCRPPEGGRLTPERQAGCVRIYSAMAGGNTLVERMIATSQMVGLTRDMPSAIEWRERYRQMRWMSEQSPERIQQLDLLDIGTNEAAALEAAMRDSGSWPPPTNWLPADEHARSLIQTGRPPPKPPR